MEKRRKTGRIIAVNEVNKNELLVVTLFTIYKFNTKSGKVIWKSATSKEAEEMENSAIGGFMKGLAEEITKDMDFDLKFYKHPRKEVFYIVAENERQSSGSSNTVIYKSNYSAYNLSDGSQVWNQPIEADGKVGEVAFLESGMLIMPDDGNRSMINLYDYHSQEGKWGKKGKGLKISGGVYDHVVTDKGIMIISSKSNKNYINFLDPNLSALKFDKPVKISGSVAGTKSVPKGIFYITSEEVNIIDPSTGELLLGESVPTKPELTLEKDGIIYALDVKSGHVVAINLAEASMKTLSKAPIKFEGKESPTGIEMKDNGILITSEQNIALIDFDGNNVYQQYYKAPREPGLKRALLYAQAIRASYIGANAYYGAAVFGNASNQTDDVVESAIYQGLGDAYGQIGDAAAEFTKKSFQQANARFKATAQGRDFMFMLTSLDKQRNTLAKINKQNGQIDASVDLGKDKEPNYEVDDITGQIYYQVKENEVVSYQF